MEKICKKFLIRGIVQGVGFRPFIKRKADELSVRGSVRNTKKGVEVIFFSEPGNIDALIVRIKKESPPGARIDSIIQLPGGKVSGKQFFIEKSSSEDNANPQIPPDLAYCRECEEDFNEKGNKRFKYPFTSCLSCGPRFSVLNAFPYDRKNLAYGEFSICPSCGIEYGDPGNRRFHAQTITCPSCGPSYRLGNFKGENAFKKAAEHIKAGNIIAVKGIGGFHLVGDPKNPQAIKKLRSLKSRGTKPLALMASSIDKASQYAFIDAAAESILLSPARPIVLLRKNPSKSFLNSVSPDNDRVGIMLPYSFAHKLLFGSSHLDLLVYTSLNPASAPTVTADEKAKEHFKGPVLTHGLSILARCDDSVIKKTGDGAVFLRRSRGYVPSTFDLRSGKNILASGASENCSFCIVKEGRAYPSQYLGDIEDKENLEAYHSELKRFMKLFSFTPDILVCDKHPGYLTTGLFEKMAAKEKVPLLKIQHHYAHLASCAYENKVTGKAIGIAWDGSGYGEDGNMWGGEFMVYSHQGFQRIGHLKYIELPGGDAASSDISRIAASYALRARLDMKKLKRVPLSYDLTEKISKMILNGMNCPLTSSVGRLIDAVAFLTGLKDWNTFSGEAAIALESAVKKDFLKDPYSIRIIQKDGKYIIDPDIMIAEIADSMERKRDISEISSRFIFTLSDIAVNMIKVMREEYGLSEVLLSGGVFLNAYIPALIRERLECADLKVHTHRQLSPSDNGISAGQAYLASRRI